MGVGIASMGFLESRRFSACDGCFLDTCSFFTVSRALLKAAVGGHGFFELLLHSDTA